MIEGVIYRYKSPSGKYYIGQTTDERKRRLNFLNIETQYSGSKIEKARKKYGPENFEYTVLMKVTGDDLEEVKKYLNTLEIGFIRMYDSFKNGYNLTEGGDGSVGYKVTEETKEKLRKANIGKHLDDEHRKKIGIGNSGKTRTEETRRKISESLKGKVHWNDGKIPLEETRRKISESLKGHISWNKGKTMSEEYKKKLSDAHKGKIPSEETRRKISESLKGHISWNKGKHLSEEQRIHISEVNTGKKKSEETKRKMSIAKKGSHRVYNPDGSYRMIKDPDPIISLW